MVLRFFSIVHPPVHVPLRISNRFEHTRLIFSDRRYPALLWIRNRMAVQTQIKVAHLIMDGVITEDEGSIILKQLDDYMQKHLGLD